MRGRRRKKRGGFLCLACIAVAEEEEKESRQRSVDSDDPSPGGLGSRRHSASLQSLTKIFGSNRSGRKRKDSDRPSLERKEQESSVKSTDNHEVDRRPVAVLSSSSSSYSLFSPSSTNSSSSSSSSSSCSLLASVTSSASLERTDMPPPRTMAASRSHRSATGAFLLLAGLTLMVLYGRLCAILWTSSWFCYVARQRSIRGRTEEVDVVLKAAAAKLKRRKWEEEEQVEEEKSCRGRPSAEESYSLMKKPNVLNKQI